VLQNAGTEELVFFSDHRLLVQVKNMVTFKFIYFSLPMLATSFAQVPPIEDQHFFNPGLFAQDTNDQVRAQCFIIKKS
jgi:hypothetical protein